MKRILSSALLLACIAAVPAYAALAVGAKAPDFDVKAALAGKEFDFSLNAALKKGPVVLYFFPAAFTPGCTVEAHDFAEATDISPYASELDGLFSSNDPTGNHKLKRGRKSSSLVSASFHDGGLPVLTWFQSATISLAPVSAREPLKVQSHFVPYLRKRGPPLTVS